MSALTPCTFCAIWKLGLGFKSPGSLVRGTAAAVLATVLGLGGEGDGPGTGDLLTDGPDQRVQTRLRRRI
jgi:hypothetical protein